MMPLPHGDFGIHLPVSRKQFCPHNIVPPLKPRSVHVFGILPLSQCSNLFIILSPHDFGLSVQLEGSNWQFLHPKLPPM